MKRNIVVVVLAIVMSFFGIFGSTVADAAVGKPGKPLTHQSTANDGTTTNGDGNTAQSSGDGTTTNGDGTTTNGDGTTTNGDGTDMAIDGEFLVVAKVVKDVNQIDAYSFTNANTILAYFKEAKVKHRDELLLISNSPELLGETLSFMKANNVKLVDIKEIGRQYRMAEEVELRLTAPFEQDEMLYGVKVKVKDPAHKSWIEKNLDPRNLLRFIGLGSLGVWGSVASNAAATVSEQQGSTRQSVFVQ